MNRFKRSLLQLFLVHRPSRLRRTSGSGDKNEKNGGNAWDRVYQLHFQIPFRLRANRAVGDWDRVRECTCDGRLAQLRARSWILTANNRKHEKATARFQVHEHLCRTRKRIIISKNILFSMITIAEVVVY